MVNRPGSSSRSRWIWARLGAGVAIAFLVVLVGGFFWLRWSAAAQRDAVAAITEARGRVFYEWDDVEAVDVRIVNSPPALLDWLPSWTWAGRDSEEGGPPAPAWLVSLLGVDCFGDVTSVSLPRGARENLLPHVGRLAHLGTLRLDGSTVTDQGLKSLDGLARLESLTLVRSRIGKGGFAHLAGLKNLQIVNLEGTKVDDHDALASLDGLTALTELNLGGTPMTDAGMSSLWGLSKLQDLNLNRTTISDAGLSQLANVTSLARLSLNGTRVSSEGLANLEGLARLEELGLENTAVGDAGLAHLAGAVNLKVLHLKGTAVGDAGVAHLQGLTNLQELTLDRTAITDAGLAHLTALPHLVIVSVQHTKVTEAGITSLKRQRAQLQAQQLAASSTGVVPPETAITEIEIVH